MSANEESTYDKLLSRYSRSYHKSAVKNVLESDIASLVRKGRTREQAINEIAKRKGIRFSSATESKIEKPQSSADSMRKISTIKKLAVLFAKGEISEETYKASVQVLEEKLGGLEQIESDIYLSRPQPSDLWYLVPFFFGIIGGLIAYVAVKDED